MGDTAGLWEKLNDLRDRMVRQEERSESRDGKIADMKEQMEKADQKLDRLVKLATEAEGAGKAAMLFGKWGYGVMAGLFIAVISNLEKLKKLLF